MITADMALGDISPDFKGSTDTERRVLKKIQRCEATPRAVHEFDRLQHLLSDYWYWFTLGTLWVSYTGWSDLGRWRRLLSSTRPNRHTSLHKPSEVAVFTKLPAICLAFRAPRAGETDWLSLTMNPTVAKRFARERGVAYLDAYEIDRSHVLALFLRRGEHELLLLDRKQARAVGSIPVTPNPEA